MEDKRTETQKWQGLIEKDGPGKRVKGEMHNSNMHGTAGAKAEPGFDAQRPEEPLFQSVALLSFKL